jgi:hypothetical protein
MNSLKTKSRKAAISTTDPLISILRNYCFLWEERELTHAQWVDKHKPCVMAAGRVLQFVGLAEPNKESAIGWKAKARFFQIAKGAAPPDDGTYETSRTDDDALVVDMLDGIATKELVDWGQPTHICGDFYHVDLVWTEFFKQREIVL